MSDLRTAAGLRGYRPALLFFSAFVVVYLLAVCTGIGQRAENALVVGFADHARIIDFRDAIGPPPLTAAEATVVVGLASLVLVALVRRQWRAGVAAIGVAMATIGGVEVLNTLILPRPDLADAPQALVAASFPSGHVAIVAGLALGAILVASERTRPYVALVGCVWLAIVAAAVQTLYWHRPSDALGATLFACGWYVVAVRLLPPATTSGSPRPFAWVTLVLAAIGSFLAGSREDGFARPLVFSATAFFCAVLVWTTVTRIPRPPSLASRVLQHRDART